MKLLDSKIAKRELKDYGLYPGSANQYKNITSEVEKHLESFIKTNNYFESL